MRTIWMMAFVLVVTCAAVHGEDAKSEIAAMLQKQDEAWNHGDLDGFVQPYDDSGQLVFIGSSGVLSDPKILKEHYEKRYGSGQSDFGKLSFSQLEVEVLADGLARAWGRWLVEQKDKKASGWFTLLLKKKPEGWRIIHDHSSSD